MMIYSRPLSRLPFGARELVSRGGAHGRTGALVRGKVLEQKRAITVEQLDKGRNGMFG